MLRSFTVRFFHSYVKNSDLGKFTCAICTKISSYFLHSHKRKIFRYSANFRARFFSEHHFPCHLQVAFPFSAFFPKYTILHIFLVHINISYGQRLTFRSYPPTRSALTAHSESHCVPSIDSDTPHGTIDLIDILSVWFIPRFEPFAFLLAALAITRRVWYNKGDPVFLHHRLIPT